MKILHIVSSYYPAFEMGGPIESVHQLNKWLIQKGIEVAVYTTDVGRRDKTIVLKKEINLDGVRVFYFPYYGYVHFTFSLALCRAVRKNIKDFDLVHITGVWNFPVIVAAFWARFYRKPYVISPRGSLMKEPLEKKSSLMKKLFLWLFIKRVFWNASAVHFTCEKEREEYLEVGLPLKKAIVIPNGIDAENLKSQTPKQNKFATGRVSNLKSDFRQKFVIPSGAKIVLFLSRLNWKKGLDTLIPAFASMLRNTDKYGYTDKKPEVVLVLAGPDEGGYKKEIELEIRNWKLEINNNVIFTGMLLDDDKIAAYQSADVFVLPSYSENFGMAVVEAMYFGLPVVITKNVGISPNVEKAGAGIVVEKDVNQVADAILKVLSNPDLAKKMGEAGRKLVETEFSSEKVAEKWMEEYGNLINS